MIRRMYDWTMSLAGRRNALPALGVVSFAESSFFPIPPDVMLLPMVLARPDRAWTIALVCTVTSVLGGVLGYAIGYYLFETIGMAVIRFYGYEAAFETFRHAYAEWGLWIILIKGMTPIPYKLVTIASGAAAFDFWVFLAASIVTRGARFYLVSGLLKYFGPPIRDFVERRLTLVTTVFVVGLVGGFVVVKYLV
jgi:membrane protein YqaA with SNARE-associated domain